MTCLIPILLTILAPDPCAVLEEVRAAWWKVNVIREWVDASRDLPYREHSLEEVGRLILIEEEDAFPCMAGLCAAALSPGLDNLTVRFARQHLESHDSFVHELGHAWSLRFVSLAEAVAVGHGGAEDPYFIFLAGWHGWMYSLPAGHPYRPQLAVSQAGRSLLCELPTANRKGTE